MAFRITGEQKLTHMAAILAEHGARKTIARRLSKTIRGEADHITKEQRKNLAEKMPHRGGLAASLAGEGRFSIRTALAGSSPNVTITDSWKGHDMRAVDAGLIRHPVFGRWVRGQRPQAVPPGLLTRPVIRDQLRLRFAIGRSLDRLAAEIAKET